MKGEFLYPKTYICSQPSFILSFLAHLFSLSPQPHHQPLDLNPPVLFKYMHSVHQCILPLQAFSLSRQLRFVKKYANVYKVTSNLLLIKKIFIWVIYFIHYQALSICWIQKKCSVQKEIEIAWQKFYKSYSCKFL